MLHICRYFLWFRQMFCIATRIPYQPTILFCISLFIFSSLSPFIFHFVCLSHCFFLLIPLPLFLFYWFLLLFFFFSGSSVLIICIYFPASFFIHIFSLSIELNLYFFTTSSLSLLPVGWLAVVVYQLSNLMDSWQEKEHLTVQLWFCLQNQKINSFK